VVRVLWLLCALLFPTILNAETPKKAQQLTIDQGLSQSTVSSVYVASDGRIWFATGDGVSIYDGQTFEYLFRSSEGKEGLQGKYARTLFEDKDGRVWIGTLGGGISVFNHDAEFIFGLQKEQGDIPAVDIYDFAQDASGAIWVASEVGTFRLVPQGEKYAMDSVILPTLLSHATARHVIVSRDNLLFIATNSEGLLRFDLKSGDLVQFKPENSSFPTKSTQVLLEERNGDIWIGSEDAGAIRFRPQDAKFDQPVALPDQNISAIVQASDGRMWFGSDENGVFAYSPIDQSLENYRFHEGQRYRLSSNSILALAEDGMGRMWIGTADGGASSVSVFPDSFETYYPDSQGLAGPVSGIIWSVEEGDQGDIWIGTKHGLSHFWQKDSHFESVELGEGSKDVRAILRRGKSLLLGIRDRGLVELDTETLALTSIAGPDGRNLFDGIYIRLLLEAQDGSIWVGTHSGVYHLDASLTLLRHYAADGVSGSLPHARTRALYETEDRTIWIGSSSGLSRFEPASDTFITYSGPNLLPDDDVRAVFQSDATTLYVGTAGGIAIINLKNGTSRFVQRQQGLPNETLYSLLPDGRGGLWATTNNGLAYFDISTEAIRVYRARDGLQGAEFNFNAYTLLSDNRIVVGGINGFSIFDPTKIGTNTLPPRLTFHSGFEDTKGKQVSGDAPVVAGDAPASLRFEFGVHHYDEAAENRLRWKIDPTDKDWNEAKGVNHVLVHESLPAGTYTLRAVGLSPSGVASEEVQYMFYIGSSPWLRWYALAGYAVITIICFIALSSLRTMQVRRRNSELETQVAEKTRELRASNLALQSAAQERASFYSRTAHEIRTPLSLIRAPLQSILTGKALSIQDRRHAELIERATQRLVQITDEMTAVSQGAAEIRGGQASVGIAAFLDPIVNLYRESAETKGVRFDTSPFPCKAVTFDPSVAETILHNLLSNAVKYTPAGGTITFSCEVQAKCLDFAIRNDGPGLPQAVLSKLKSYAVRSDLPTAQRGVELIGVSIRAAGGTLEAQAEGASIRVSLPAHSSGDESKQNPASTSTERILVVEDDRDLREYLSELLSPLAEVQTVASLAAARRAVEGQVFHLVLCDVNLPDGSGFDFGTWMKEEVETSHIPLVFLTARTDEPSYKKGLSAWADDYLTKPFEASELLAKIRIRLRAVTRVREHLVKQLSHHTPSGDETPTLPPIDERFVERFQAFLKAQIGNSAASIEEAAKHCAMSKRVLQRKLDALYGRGFSNLLTTARMTHAAELLKAGMSVSEAANTCAYQSPSSFSRQFRETYGQSPRDFVKNSSH
jgi:ligand-binding sensor domain-containing protein/signal transduction histidine kinase/CheY-like chemotaxis protein